MKLKLSIILFIIISVESAFAQDYSITGTVTDSSNNPLAGVNIILLNTGYGAATNSIGKYEIKKLKPGRYTIEFSMVGYESIIFPGKVIKNQSILLNVVMKEKAVQSEPVVVTAGKYEQKVSDLPVSANVIPAEMFAQKDITDLRDAMRYVPGVSMVDDQISIRGSSGYSRGAGTRVLLELDGIPYYTGDTGEIIWEIIPVSEIARVEVIKGAASALYGSSAIGGVVNVITKHIGEKSRTYIKTGIGFYGNPAYTEWKWSNETRTFTQLTAVHSGRIGNFGFTLSLTRLHNMGYKQSGFYTRYIGYVKGNYNFSPTSSLMFFANSLNKDGGNFLYWKDSRHALVPPDADLGQRVISNRYMIGTIYKNVLSNDYFLNVKASFYGNNWKDQTASHNSSISDIFRGEVQINKTFGDNLIIVSGAEATTSQVTSNIFGNPTAFGFGIYTQADYKVQTSLKLSAGTRYDYTKLNNSRGLSAFSPKFGINYRVTNKLILRYSFGTGFRAPTLAEAFTSTSASGITIKPNPSLKPEHNWTLEFGANYQLFDFVNLDVAIFQNEFYDFIEPGVDLTDGLFHFDNVTRARIQGFEFDINSGLLNNKLQLSINYAYLWARDLTLNKPLKYRPRNSVTTRLDYYFAGFDFGADFRYWSKVEQMDFELVNLGIVKDGRERVAAYILDLRAGYNLNHFGIPAQIHFNINNVLNYNYVELIGNLAPIRNYSLSTEFLF